MPGCRPAGPTTRDSTESFVITMGCWFVLHAAAALLVLFFRALSRPASGHRTIVTDGFDDPYEQLPGTAPRLR
ncbi:hypothetical protein E143388_06439 [Rhodococcus opacus]|nr:hypothetical protein E143388_06439 [Rhodococcus opacus]